LGCVASARKRRMKSLSPYALRLVALLAALLGA
jgi:hypothetical protein